MEALHVNRNIHKEGNEVMQKGPSKVRYMNMKTVTHSVVRQKTLVKTRSSEANQITESAK